MRVSESAVLKVLQALIAECGRGRDVPDLASAGIDEFAEDATSRTLTAWIAERDPASRVRWRVRIGGYKSFAGRRQSAD